MSVNEGERTTASAVHGAVPNDSFGNRLMLARAHAGHLSIREAAELCDIGRGAWTNWEKGARPVGLIEIAEVVSEKLGVDRDWLIFGGPLTTPEPAGRRQLKRRSGRAGATNESGRQAVRAIEPRPDALVTASNAVPRGPFAHVSDRPTAAVNRPSHRRERAHTGPSASRPAILPRRTIV